MEYFNKFLKMFIEYFNKFQYSHPIIKIEEANSRSRGRIQLFIIINK